MIMPADIPETTLLNYLNPLDPHLKFTMETEIQEKLNFFDVTIQRENENIITSWYRKSSNTLNFTSWNSFGPKIHKINTVKAMIKRLKVICSDKQTLTKDLEELKMSFIRSNYPVNLLNRLFVERPERRKVPMASPKIVYFGIKYYNDKSVKFAQRLAKIINKYNGAVKVVPYFKTGRKLLSYFSAKIKQFVRDTSVGVYNLPCMDCNRSYIGETGKSMRIRMKQHESNCRNSENRDIPGAVVKHHKLGHSIDFENACVIYPESHMTKRKIAESFLISQQRKQVMDDNKSSFSLRVFKQ
jgi:hypothetical protein